MRDVHGGQAGVTATDFSFISAWKETDNVFSGQNVTRVVFCRKFTESRTIDCGTDIIDIQLLSLFGFHGANPDDSCHAEVRGGQCISSQTRELLRRFVVGVQKQKVIFCRQFRGVLHIL